VSVTCRTASSTQPQDPDPAAETFLSGSRSWLKQPSPPVGSKARAVVATALLGVAAPIAIGSGVVLLAIGLITSQPTTLMIAIVPLSIGAWTEFQRRRNRSRPLLVLILASVGMSAAVLLGERSAAASALPVFALFTFVGVFTLSRPAAIRFGIWCGTLAIVSMTRLFPDPTAPEVAAIGVSLTATLVAGFRLLARADDTLIREEERLAAALMTNQHLLSFEQAIATCSRALLLGDGEDPLQEAMHTLRSAIGGDSAYLLLNVSDDELGPCFRIVNASKAPSSRLRDGIGKVIPWSDWREAYQQLSRGEPYQRVNPGEDVVRMGVPIFNGARWMGVIGFRALGSDKWSQDAIRLLTVAAPMLATYWDRESTRLRLEDLLRSKDRFVASISHELRTPLAAVMGFAEELKLRAHSFDTEELTEMLELIAQQSHDMADMVEDLLVAARADIGTVSVRPQVVYLRSQAEAAVLALGSAQSAKIRVTGGPGESWADPSRTRQIIRNLLTNAIRYGGDEISVTAETVGPITTLTVRDNGPGLPRADWERIFEPYERAHDRPTQPASIGLGLTVSRQLARLMGGDVAYRSDASGSIFQLNVPSEPTESGHPAAKKLIVSRT